MGKEIYLQGLYVELVWILHMVYWSQANVSINFL